MGSNHFMDDPPNMRKNLISGEDMEQATKALTRVV
jgi:hypothetical protein